MLKLVNIKILSAVLLFGLFIMPLVINTKAAADHQRCYLSLQRGMENSLVNCPATSDSGVSVPAGYPDPTKCYTLSGPQLRVTSISESDCSSSRFSHDGSNPGDPADPSVGANLEGDCNPGTGALDKNNCAIVGYILTITNVLSSAVGIVIVIMIAVGGIQYSAARDDPQAVSAAKTRIRNAILALVFYLFAFAFLQYLIPGGLF